MKIIKVGNFKKYAEELRTQTGCTTEIEVLGKDHVHYQLNKDGISLGVLCINEGDVTFAPFVRLDTARDEQYIDMQYMPLFDDLAKLFTIFRAMFVED